MIILNREFQLTKTCGKLALPGRKTWQRWEATRAPTQGLAWLGGSAARLQNMPAGKR